MKIETCKRAASVLRKRIRVALESQAVIDRSVASISTCEDDLRLIVNEPRTIRIEFQRRLRSYKPRQLPIEPQRRAPLKSALKHLKWMHVEAMRKGTRTTKRRRWVGFIGGALLCVDDHIESAPTQSSFVAELLCAEKLTNKILFGDTKFDQDALLGMIEGIIWWHGLFSPHDLKRINKGEFVE